MFTITIPTWNRAALLDEALASLYTYNDLLSKHKIGIYISDNCSADSTPQVISKWEKKFPSFRSHRMDKYVAVDYNILSLTEACRGEKIFFMGDDDRMTESGLNLLTENAKLDFSTVIFRDYRGNRGSCPEIDGPKEMTLLGMCNAYGWMRLLGFIGSFMVQVPPNKNIPNKIFPNYFPHAGIVLSLNYNKACRFVPEPILEIGSMPDNMGKYARQIVNGEHMNRANLINTVEFLEETDPGNTEFSPFFFMTSRRVQRDQLIQEGRGFLWDSIANAILDCLDIGHKIPDNVWISFQKSCMRAPNPARWMEIFRRIFSYAQELDAAQNKIAAEKKYLNSMNFLT